MTKEINVLIRQALDNIETLKGIIEDGDEGDSDLVSKNIMRSIREAINVKKRERKKIICEYNEFGKYKNFADFLNEDIKLKCEKIL